MSEKKSLNHQKVYIRFTAHTKHTQIILIIKMKLLIILFSPISHYHSFQTFNKLNRIYSTKKHACKGLHFILVETLLHLSDIVPDNNLITLKLRELVDLYIEAQTYINQTLKRQSPYLLTSLKSSLSQAWETNAYFENEAHYRFYYCQYYMILNKLD